MNLSNVHFEQEVERFKSCTELANKIQPILTKEFKHFFSLGMAENERVVNSQL